MIKKDAIIIGSGQAAKPLSEKLSAAGWKTVMVEVSEEALGGTCLNSGCTPSKTLIASANVMQEILTAGKHGLTAEPVQIDYSVTQKRKDKVIHDSKEALKKRIEKAENLELIYGKASFSDRKTISVTKENGEVLHFTAEYIFIDAGSRPRIPKIDGLEEVPWYDSSSILDLPIIPGKLVIAGGGYIGLELGQMFSRLGSKVIIAEHGEFLEKEDEEVASAIREILEDEGLEIHTGAMVKSVRSEGAELTVTFEADGKSTDVTASHFLIATGRESNADRLNLPAAGIEVDDRGYIRVDDRLQTNVEHVFALGDINGGPQFTHVAYNDYLIVYENLVEKKNVSKANRGIPYCMYTDPQLGRVGMTETEARKQKLDIIAVEIPGSRISRGIETGKRQGPWKAVVDKETGKVLGASIVGTEGGEIAAIIQMAMQGGITAKQLSRTMFSHPSYAESINTLFLELEK